jgi:hypothetical protein
MNARETTLLAACRRAREDAERSLKASLRMTPEQEAAWKRIRFDGESMGWNSLVSETGVLMAYIARVVEALKDV